MKDQRFLMIAGAITAILMPTIVFLPTVLLKLAGVVSIIAGACGLAALVIKFKKP